MKLKTILPLFICLFFIISCDDDHDNWWNDGSRNVKSIKINAQRAHVGDIIPVDTYFETKDEMGVPKDLELVIRIDPELQYVNGSSKLYIEGDGERRSPDRITTCDNGVVYLMYDLDNDDDLEYYTGSKDFNMRFEIIAAARAGMARIQARAGKDVDYSCNEEFMYQEEDGLIVE